MRQHCLIFLVCWGSTTASCTKYSTSVNTLYWSWRKNSTIKLHRHWEDRSTWPHEKQGHQKVPSTTSIRLFSPCRWWGQVACPDRLPTAESWACRQQVPRSWSPLESWPEQVLSSPSGCLHTTYTHITQYQKRCWVLTYCFCLGLTSFIGSCDVLEKSSEGHSCTNTHEIGFCICWHPASGAVVPHLHTRTQ